jgi:hypothetical protein
MPACNAIAATCPANFTDVNVSDVRLYTYLLDHQHCTLILQALDFPSLCCLSDRTCRMRLLRIHDDGDLSLIEFFGEDIPCYAIVSHTWGADNEEVSFKGHCEEQGQKQTWLPQNSFLQRPSTEGRPAFFFCLTRAASSRTAARKSVKPLTQCSAGIIMQSLATRIFPMSGSATHFMRIRTLNRHGYRPSGPADGSLVDGLSKASCPYIYRVLLVGWPATRR